MCKESGRLENGDERLVGKEVLENKEEASLERWRNVVGLCEGQVTNPGKKKRGVALGKPRTVGSLMGGCVP